MPTLSLSSIILSSISSIDSLSFILKKCVSGAFFDTSLSISASLTSVPIANT
uniref:Uncharacterized protein n=1 Tax=Anguilla anguilla TaxID=7936 RepID=A0A0E9XZK7_ANGAN